MTNRALKRVSLSNPSQPKDRPPRKYGLFQLCVLGFRLLQDRDVGVGVFPKRKKILVGCARFPNISYKGIGTRDIQLRKRYELARRFETPVIQNLLELRSGFFSVLHPQVDESTDVHKPIGGLAPRPDTQLIRAARLPPRHTPPPVPPPQFAGPPTR